MLHHFLGRYYTGNLPSLDFGKRKAPDVERIRLGGRTLFEGTV